MNGNDIELCKKFENLKYPVYIPYYDGGRKCLEIESEKQIRRVYMRFDGGCDIWIYGAIYNGGNVFQSREDVVKYWNHEHAVNLLNV